MTTFGAIGIASTGLTVHRKWLDAVSDNLANMNTVRGTDEAAFQAKFVVAEAANYGNDGLGDGVRVKGIELGSAEGRMTYEPDHPLADAEGYVRYPDIDMATQMTSLLMAQRGYQANLAVVERATQAYQAALQLGR